MRFAEEMLLNAKLYKLVPYTRLSTDEGRCALGLVGNSDYGGYGFGAERKHPWLYNSTTLPCECDKLMILSIFGTAIPYSMVEDVLSITVCIAHLFNEHVMQGGLCHPGAEPWTLERLADWIDSVDPTPRLEPVAAEQTPQSEGLRELLLSPGKEHMIAEREAVPSKV